MVTATHVAKELLIVSSAQRLRVSVSNVLKSIFWIRITLASLVPPLIATVEFVSLLIRVSLARILFTWNKENATRVRLSPNAWTATILPTARSAVLVTISSWVVACLVLKHLTNH